MKRLMLLLFLLVTYHLFLITHVLAEGEFSTSYDVTYKVNLDGVTDVVEKITLKNLTPNFYAQNFILTIGSTDISDLSASDSTNSPLEIKKETVSSRTNLTIKLNQQVVGKDKKQTFELKYSSKDFAQIVGKVWQVTLPKVPTSANLDRYNILLSVPVSFGDPTSISPRPKSSSQNVDVLNFTFDKDQLQSAGVSASFGQFQTFGFSLNYTLGNNLLLPYQTSLPLPPTTPYQQVVITKIEPAPIDVTYDGDGNILAHYKLSRNSHTQIKVTGQAKLSLAPQNPNLAQPTPKQLLDWTKEDKYWAKDNPAIKLRLSEIISTSKLNNHDKARLIYRFVVDNLRYDNTKFKSLQLSRLGAVTALNNPDSSSCMEFSDLFITLARAAAVPARQLVGFAYSTNKILRPVGFVQNGRWTDSLHCWPEYFDEKGGWVMVDPVWENTSGGVDYFNKFDLDHLVLTVQGVSSQNPVTTSEVNIFFSQDSFKTEPKLMVNFNISTIIWAGLQTRAKIIFTNVGNYQTQPTYANLDSSFLLIDGDRKIKIPSLPPFGHFEYQFDLRSNSILNNFEDNLVVNVDGKSFVHKVLVQPIFLFRGSYHSYLAAVATILVVYVGVLTGHYFQKRN